MPDFKPQFASDYQEFETHDSYDQASARKARTIDSARLGLTVLAFLVGITVLSTSADTVAVFNQTFTSQNALLPVWPSNFNVRPAVALVIAGAVMVVANAVSLIASKIPSVHTILSILAPLAAGAAAIVATAFFYIVNGSDVVDSLHSWSCRWANVGMSSQPHFGTLCSESKAALYLTVAMIPLEAIVLAVAALGVSAEKKTTEAPADRKGSPAMS